MPQIKIHPTLPQKSFNSKDFMKEVVRIRKLMLKNDPKRFQEHERSTKE